MKSFKSILLDDLKSQGLTGIVKKIKSVTSTYSSARVRTIDLLASEREKLEAICNKYVEGHFDGMIDLYEYDRDKVKQARMFRYVFVSNETSPDMEKWAIDYLARQWDIVDDTTAQEKMSCWYSNAIARIIYQYETLSVQS
jgi:hypothetical protein